MGNDIKIEPSPTKAVTIRPTSVALTWKNDPTASNYTDKGESEMVAGQRGLANQTSGNKTDSSPGSNGTSGNHTAGKMNSFKE